MVGQFGRLKTGIWLIRHNDECAILELPDLHDDDPFCSWEKISEYIEQEHLNLKFITATHNHGDHFDTYPQFYKTFPEVPIVVNPQFFQKRSISDFIGCDDLYNAHSIKSATIKKGVPFYCFKGNYFEVDLGGEPMFLLPTPKHSWSDTMVVFRGSMITGDWWLGPGDPNPNQIPIDVINKSIDSLINFSRERNYRIHTLMSVHANEFRRGIDFIKLMEETRPKSE